MRRFLHSALLTLAAFRTAGEAHAATFTLTPVVADSYTTAFIPIPGPADTTTLDGAARVIQVDFHIGTNNLQPGERGFANVGFNIQLDGLVEAGAGGWNPSHEWVDFPPGVIIPGIIPLYATNLDAGPSSQDLQGILASIAGGISNPQPYDTRTRIGQPGGPSYLGSVYLLWSAGAPAKLTIPPPMFAPNLTEGKFGRSQIEAGATLIFGVPEPTTCLLACVAVVSLCVCGFNPIQKESSHRGSRSDNKFSFLSNERKNNYV